MQQQIFSFFKKNIDPSKPILLGLSGGPDSTCLLHLLLEFRKEIYVDLHLIHVNHGWRKESDEEEVILKKIAENLNLPIHTKRLSPAKYKGNLESEARKDRIEFFTEVSNLINSQGILLGHHAQDQVETVFKKILEGSMLSCLSGMLPKVSIGDLVIFRPFLEISKEKILKWLQNRNISFFTDSTNNDPSYLRGKMRSEIFPYLRKSFGKEFEGSIYNVSEEAKLLRSYFDEKMKAYLETVKISDLGSQYDFSKSSFEHPYEIQQLFRVMGEKEGFYLNRSEMELAIFFFKSGSSNKWITTNKHKIYFDRKKIFLFRKLTTTFGEDLTLKIGSYEWGEWRVSVQKINSKDGFVIKNHWKDLFFGRISSILPVGEYKLISPRNDLRRYFGVKKESKKIGEYLNDKKVPRVFAHLSPFVVSQNFVFEDFLGNFEPQFDENSKIYIELERNLCN